jgi:hypothetical protein
VRPAELVRVMPCRAVAYTARKWSAILNRQVLVAMCADAVALVYVWSWPESNRRPVPYRVRCSGLSKPIQPLVVAAAVEGRHGEFFDAA